MEEFAKRCLHAACGAVLGALAGLVTCIWLITDPPFFPGDTMLIGAVVFGAAAFIWGDGFFEWVGDNWWWW